MPPVAQVEFFDLPETPEISSFARVEVLPEHRLPERHPDVCDHVWHPHATSPHYLILQGFTSALVRTRPSHNGRYLWQFRKVASYADTVEQAKDYVEAGAEFFAVMHRNPYGA